MNYLDVELALARHFDCRKNLIVPNVSWGLGFNHELDLAVLTHSGYLWEIEIKMSKADLKRDKQKGHGHYSNRISRLYFSYPEDMDGPEIREHIPPRAGIVIVRNAQLRGTRIFPAHADLVRAPIRNRDARPIDKSEQETMHKLAAMRVWSLKQHIHSMITRYEKKKEKAGHTRIDAAN